MWNALLQNGVYLNLALPPATPDNRPLLRSSVSAAHTPEQIDTVLERVRAARSANSACCTRRGPPAPSA